MSRVDRVALDLGDQDCKRFRAQIFVRNVASRNIAVLATKHVRNPSWLFSRKQEASAIPTRWITGLFYLKKRRGWPIKSMVVR